MPRLAIGAAAVLVLFAAAFGLGRVSRSSGDAGAALPGVAAPASAPLHGVSGVAAVPALRVVRHRAKAPAKHESAPATAAPAPPASPQPAATPRPTVTPVRPVRRGATKPAPAPSKPTPDDTIIGGGRGG